MGEAIAPFPYDPREYRLPELFEFLTTYPNVGALRKPSLLAARRSLFARALGMDDLGCVGGQWLIPFPVFIRNQPKHGTQFD